VVSYTIYSKGFIVKIKDIEKLANATNQTIGNWKNNRKYLYLLLKHLSQEEVVNIVNRAMIDDKKLTVKDVFGE
jgi:hypothetical protein